MRSALVFLQATIKRFVRKALNTCNEDRTYVGRECAILRQNTVGLASQGSIRASWCSRPMGVVRGKVGADPLANFPVLDIFPNCDDLPSAVRGGD